MSLLSYRTVIQLTRVCKRLRKLTTSEKVWKMLFNRDLSEVVVPIYYRDAYKSYHIQIERYSRRDYSEGNRIYWLTITRGYEKVIYRYDNIRKRFNTNNTPEHSWYFDCQCNGLFSELVKSNRVDLILHCLHKKIFTTSISDELHDGLKTAIECGHDSIMEELLNHGALVDNAVLGSVCVKGDLSLWKRLLNLMREPLDLYYLCGRAVEEGQLHILHQLYPNKEVTNNDLATTAASHKQWHVLEYLLDQGCNNQTELLKKIIKAPRIDLIKRLVKEGADYKEVLTDMSWFQCHDVLNDTNENIEYLLSLP